MDFDLSEEQQEIRDLARRILTDEFPPERLRAIESGTSPDTFTDDVWQELAKADLLGISLPDPFGGGFGFLEACLLLEEAGRAVAPLPLMPTLILGALPVARFGSGELQQTLLHGVANGSVILTAALQEEGDYSVPALPATRATAERDRWRVEGVKTCVPAAHLASRILVPARTGDAASTVFLVDPASPGVRLETSTTLNLERQSIVHLEGVEVGAADILGGLDAGNGIVSWILERAIAAQCAVQVGVCDGALALTAAYVSEREQFGAKIGTFQAVAQRIADAYIDTEAIRLTALQAAWRLDQGLDADDALAIAKFWAAEGGHRVVHAAQHLHGGIGMDVDYPVHRYFRWTKAMEPAFGHATAHLRNLGQRIAATPA